MDQHNDDPKNPSHTPTVRKGEEAVKHDGKEPGRHDSGTTGAGRPAGTSDARDSTMVNPAAEEPIDKQSPKMPPA